MKLLYYNLDLSSMDGSGIHASGMLDSLVKILGAENVMIEGIRKQDKHIPKLERNELSRYLVFVRLARRLILSIINAERIYRRSLLTHFKPDYIMARSVLYDFVPIILAKKFHSKLIIEHNSPLVYEVCHIKKEDLRIPVRFYEKMVLRKANGIYVVSECLKKYLISEYGHQDKIEVITNGYISRLFIVSHEEREKKRSNIRIKENANNKWIVIFIGSLQRYHGIDNLLDAARRIENHSNIEFWVLGDGEKREEVSKYASSHKNLKWFGNLDIQNMRDYLFAADLGIMPYHKIKQFYFSPLKMYDMIGAELPFIGLNIGQIKEVCESELNTDFLIEKADGESLSNKVLELNRNNRKYDTMKQLLSSIRNNHTWDTRAKHLIEWMKTI